MAADLAMSDFTVIVPFRMACDSHREVARQFVKQWLVEHHTWDVLTEFDEPATDTPWSKGAVVDQAVQRCETRGLIIHDADVFVQPITLGRAVAAVAAGFAWAQPHNRVSRLSRRGTRRLLDREPLDQVDVEREHHPAAGGGIVVLSRDSYDAVGGIDPRFIGWGGEDISFARALDTIAGPGYRGTGMLWHLWHQEQPMPWGRRRGSPDAERLAGMYAEAEGDADAMQSLCRR